MPLALSNLKECFVFSNGFLIKEKGSGPQNIFYHTTHFHDTKKDVLCKALTLTQNAHNFAFRPFVGYFSLQGSSSSAADTSCCRLLQLKAPLCLSPGCPSPMAITFAQVPTLALSKSGNKGRSSITSSQPAARAPSDCVSVYYSTTIHGFCPENFKQLVPYAVSPFTFHEVR